MTDMNKIFRAQFQQSPYPEAFLEKYEIIECLASSRSSETLFVSKRGGNEYRIAKVVDGAEFNVEGELLGTLSHPGLPAFDEQIVEGNTHIVIRSFVEGKPLNEVMAERRMLPDEAVAICAQICDVLSYLHAQKPPIIHRDIKPENVILGPGGLVTLIDLGIARVYKNGAKRDTVFSGTSEFAPPEQYGFAQTDARTDIYALGMLLKFLLTNGRPEEEVKAPRLGRVVRRCTSFSPRDRYSSAAAVKRALLRTGGAQGPRWPVVVAVALAALYLGLLAGRFGVSDGRQENASVAFVEPVMEQAARLMLSKPDGPLTTEDLAKVVSVQIVAGEAYADNAAFEAAFEAWNSSPDKRGDHGPAILADLALFPNLRHLRIVSGSFADLYALAGCEDLESLKVYGNENLVDINGVSGLSKLTWVDFGGCDRIMSIAPLSNLPDLTYLYISCDSAVYNPVPLENMGDFIALNLRGCLTAYQYLHGKRICELWLTGTGIDSLESLRTVTGLEELHANYTPLASLEGIQAHQELRMLDVCHTQITDLSPLLKLPGLRELVLSPDMEVDLDVLSPMSELEIRYE